MSLLSSNMHSASRHAASAAFVGDDAAAVRQDVPVETPDVLPTTASRFLLRQVRRRLFQFVTLMVLIATATACAVGVQYGMKLIVDTMSAGDRGTSVIWQWLALFIGLIVAESLLWRASGWLGCRVVVATGVDIRLDLFRHLAGHPMRYFGQHFSGALGNRVGATAGACSSILSTLSWRILPPIIDFVGAVVVLLTIDPRMSLALVCFVVLTSLTMAIFGLRGRRLHQAFAEQSSKIGGELVDVVSNIWAVKAFSASEREYGRMQRLLGNEAQAHRRSWLYLEKARVLHDVFLWLMAGGMLGWAIHSWSTGVGTSGDVVVISALTFRILHGSRDLALTLVDAAQQFGVIGEMLGIIAVRHEVTDAPGAAAFEPRQGAIRLVDVDFGYVRGEPVLRGFNLDIAAGQRIGVVGPSGAGKSTLLHLLQRLDDVREGAVLIDGQDVRSVRQDTLRAAIAVVPQDIALLNRSVIENIRYGRPDASDFEVYEAARDAGCDDFIAAMPEGYETLVGERGTRLSAGQRQRLGIARAFLRNAPILLLDEATSALDSESEAKIQQALDRLMRGRTVVSVAHRLSTVAGFDRVVVVEHGRIVEDGPPDELRRAGGTFARLWQLQAGEPEEAPRPSARIQTISSARKSFTLVNVGPGTMRSARGLKKL